MRMPGFTASAGLSTQAVARRNIDIEIGPITLCDCVPACRVGTICILGYCAETTICSDCAYVTNCRVLSSG